MAANDHRKGDRLLENDEPADEPETHGTLQTLAGVMGNVLEW